jgi:hypothetical protein
MPAPIFDSIPQEIKNLKQWTLWKKRASKKIPYQRNGRKARSNDSSTWCDFNNATMTFVAWEEFDGICWMMPPERPTAEGIIFIDIDHCIKDGVIEPWAQKVVDQFNSYTEISQSGNGLHILIKGTKPIKRCRRNGSPYEIYDCLRPCYLTGNRVGKHRTIETRQDQLDQLFEDIFPKEMKATREEPKPPKVPVCGSPSLSDGFLIQKALQAKNGQDFKALWDGSIKGYNDDDSAADMALMNHLAFWTCGNASQTERLFSRSGLGQRDKWRDRQDYRERTIRRAISDAKEFYKPSEDDLRLDKAHELIKDLPEKLKADPKVIEESPQIQSALKIIHDREPLVFDRIVNDLEGIKPRSLIKQLKMNGKDESQPTTLTKIIQRIPAWIKSHHFKTVADTERIYHYDHGVYFDDGEKVLKAQIEKEFGDITTETIVRDVVGKVRRRTYVDRDAFNN